jgi:hypothetical protein
LCFRAKASSWYTDEELDDDNEESDTRAEEEDNDYQKCLDRLENEELPTERDNDRLMNYWYAMVAISIDEQISMRVTVFMWSALTEAYSDDASHINSVLSSLGSSLANSLPAVNTNEHSNAFTTNNSESSAVDLTELVRLRFLHQTKQAATGVRIGSNTNETAFEKKKLLTDRQKILREFNQILKQQEDRGVGTGLDRKVRWQNGTTQPDAAASAKVKTINGNSANAELAAKATASKVG